LHPLSRPPAVRRRAGRRGQSSRAHSRRPPRGSL